MAVDLPDLNDSNGKSAIAQSKNSPLSWATSSEEERRDPDPCLERNVQLSTCGSDDHWILAIAGWDESGYETELKRIAAGPSVVFLGPQFGADNSECYRACDAFILPSLSEGLPMRRLKHGHTRNPDSMTPECNLPEGFEADAALRVGTGSEGNCRRS